MDVTKRRATTGEGSYFELRIEMESSVKSAGPKAQVLTKSQAACLVVLRKPGFSQRRIAGAAKLDLKKTEAALRKLAELGLVRRGDSKLWSATATGESCDFETVADPRPRRSRPPDPELQFDLADHPQPDPGYAQPGPSAQRLLDLLDRPKGALALARESGFSRERVEQLLIRLRAQGRIVSVDPDHPSWLIKRADDESAVLDRDETRVLSAIPAERAAEGSRLMMVKALAQCDVERILHRLVEGGLVGIVASLSGAPAFRLTAAGLEHPQYLPPKRLPPPSHLPVRSDRVRLVLQTIADAGALRIRDVKLATNIPQRSINALMQYLKRKRLVVKMGAGFDDPYRLTDAGAATLAEMSLRRAA
jgi:DNA-binding IclR family transcriptional regulator